MRFHRPFGFRGRLMRFFTGRNGADALYYASFVPAIVCVVLMRFVRTNEHLYAALFILYLFFLGYAFFRLLSRNIPKRRKEDLAFRRILGRFTSPVRRARLRFRDRKTHIFRKCPNCKNTLRLKRIPGKHTVCCPACGNRFSVKVKK